MANFETLLDSVARRPALHVGTCSLSAVGHYLEGYSHAVRDLGHSEPPLDGWGRWVESSFLISHPAWHWTRILLHVYVSDTAAVEALPRLYREFLRQRASLGLEGIHEECRHRLIAAHGSEIYEPPVTDTTVGH